MQRRERNWLRSLVNTESPGFMARSVLDIPEAVRLGGGSGILDSILRVGLFMGKEGDEDGGELTDPGAELVKGEELAGLIAGHALVHEGSDDLIEVISGDVGHPVAGGDTDQAMIVVIHEEHILIERGELITGGGCFRVARHNRGGVLERCMWG